MRRVYGATVTRPTLRDLLFVQTADVTRDHSNRPVKDGEAPNKTSGIGTECSMAGGDADKRAKRPDRNRGGGGGTARNPASGHQKDTARNETADWRVAMVREEEVRRENMLDAYHRVVQNKGTAGVEGVSVQGLWHQVSARWSVVREELLEGKYRPDAVRKVEIPKPGGAGTRTLGVPSVMDRLIQRARLIVGAGYRWVVEIDLEQCSDRINHDVLMSWVARRITDRRILLVIRRFLQAGMMAGGVISPRSEETPQERPLSPLLSNILLDEWDRELERRGHAFVRYADD